jgi:hypothetical protein
MIVEASYIGESVYSKRWDDLTVADLWELEEEAHSDFLYYSREVADCGGDQGNGLYEFEVHESEYHDIWMHARYLLEAVSSLIQGW